MKIYIKISDYSILKIEKEYPALVGDNNVDSIKLMFDTNPATALFYPTLNIQKPTGQKIGNIMFDTATPSFPHTVTDSDSNTWYEYDFTLSTTNRQLGVSGSYQATAVINLYNSDEIIIGQRGINFNFNVLNAVSSQDNGILILGENAFDVVADLYELMQSLETSIGNLSNSKANMTDSTQDITAKSLTAETLTATTKVNTPLIDMEADADNSQAAYIDINGKHKVLMTEDLMVIFQKAANNFSNLGLVLAEDTFYVVLKDANDTTFGLTLSPSGGFSVFAGSHGFNFDGTKIEVDNEELATKTYVDDNTIGVIEIGTNTGTLTASQLLLLSRPDCIVKNTNTLEYYRKTNTYNNGSYRFEYKTIYIYDNVKYLETKYCTISNAGAWEFGIDDIPFYDRTQADNKFALITETGNKIQLEMNSTTFKIVAKLYDKNNTLLSTSSEIDLPMESVVVSGEYDEETQKVILTLQNGSTIEFSIADLVDGLQAKITSENPLDADLVDDTNATHKFVSAEEKAQITANANNITALQSGKQNTIDSTHKLSSDLVEDISSHNKFYLLNENLKKSDIVNGTHIPHAKFKLTGDLRMYADLSKTVFKIDWTDEEDEGSYDIYCYLKRTDSDDDDEQYHFSSPDNMLQFTLYFYEENDYAIVLGVTNLMDRTGENITINSFDKLPSDFIFDTNQTNKFVTSTEKATWNGTLQQAKSYTDSKIEDLKWELGTYDLSVDMDTTTAYTKAVPSGAIGCKINTIGGMSYKINQLMGNGDFVNTTGWSGARGTISVSNNTCKYTISELTGSDIESHRIQKTTSYVSGHTYFMSYFIKSPKNCHATITCPNGGIGYNVQGTSVSANTKTLVTRIATANSSGTNLFYFCFDGYNSQNGFVVGDKIEYTACQTFDLTAMGIDTTDVSTAISELAKRGIDINTYQEYNTGSIRDSAVTSVVSEDSNNTTIDTLTIADEIQALEGYGWGINDTCYNYIDYDSKKFIQKVGRIDIGTIGIVNITKYDVVQGTLFRVFFNGVKTISDTNITPNALCQNYTTTSSNNRANMTISQSIGNLAIDFINNSYSTAEEFKTAMSGVYLYYELATPVETDISEYITTNEIEIANGGTLTFTNTYEQAVPSDIDYLIEEVKA